jgi:two-component system response regulator LytT
MTTIIIEDEKPAARMLQRKLEKLDIPVQVMLHSVREAVEWFQQNPHPDLIFLDIQLSDGLSLRYSKKYPSKVRSSLQQRMMSMHSGLLNSTVLTIY